MFAVVFNGEVLEVGEIEFYHSFFECDTVSDAYDCALSYASDFLTCCDAKVISITRLE